MTVAPLAGADRVEEREDGVETGLGGPMVPAEPLEDLDLLLRHDLDRLHDDDQQEQGNDEECVGRHAGVTSSTMPSAPTTRTLVPEANGPLLRAAQS